MTIESSLTRELNIRFIDARAIATEAKLNLGIDGYPSMYEESQIIEEAVRIYYHDKSRSQKQIMKTLNTKLNIVKNNKRGSMCSSSSSYDGGSSDDFSLVSENSSRTSKSNKFKMTWPTMMRRR